MMAATLSSLEQKIGYSFRDHALCEHALTHSSRGGKISNERLEFLGDRVLNLVIAHGLFERFPKEAEGQLAKRHAALVQGRMLASVARNIGLSEFVILSDAERQYGGAENDNILSDAMEALLGAVYLDGGLEPARQIILALWGDSLTTLNETHQDPKTELQEWVQARALPLPEYEIVDKTGPDHAPLFVVELRVEGHKPMRREGASRRAAEKIAAAAMLSHLRKEKK